jgi:hypothetical protein
MPFEHLPAVSDVRRLLLLVDAKAGKFGFHARPIETGLGKPRVDVERFAIR